MSTTLTRAEALAAIGVKTDKAISAAIMAEYARAAMFALYDGTPVTTQRLIGGLEERLAPLAYFPSRAIASFFTNEEDPDDEDDPAPLKQAIDDLVEIGDFISIGGGRYHPASPRVVKVDANVTIVVGGSPTRHLESRFAVDFTCPTLARLASQPMADHLPQQELASWLGAPTAELKQWTQAQLLMELEPTHITAEEWEVARDREGLSWIKASTLSGLEGTFICREPRDKVNGSRKFLARFERNDGVLMATSARAISNVECRRLIHGQRLILGINRRVFSSECGELISIRLHQHTLPEVLRMLKALCHAWTMMATGQIEFMIARSLRDSVKGFLSRYAMHLSTT